QLFTTMLQTWLDWPALVMMVCDCPRLGTLHEKTEIHRLALPMTMLAWMASQRPDMFEPAVAVHVSDWLLTVAETMLQASNVLKPSPLSPAVQPAGLVQVGLPL